MCYKAISGNIMEYQEISRYVISMDIPRYQDISRDMLYQELSADMGYQEIYGIPRKYIN